MRRLISVDVVKSVPLIIVGLLVVLAFVFLSPVSADKPRPFAVYEYRQFQNPVEQQTPGGALQQDRSLWVVNNTECAWDPDDYLYATGFGVLRAGESYSYSACIIGDWQAHGVWALTSDPNLVGTVTISGGPIGRCIIGPDYDHETTLLQPIENSNGGVGLRHEVTWTITNVSPKAIRKASSMFALAHRSLADVSGPDNCQPRQIISGDPRWEWMQ